MAPRARSDFRRTRSDIARAVGRRPRGCRSPRCMYSIGLHTSSSTMVRSLSLAQHTLLADLLQQSADELFDPEFPENGSVLVRPGRAGARSGHVYYQGYRRDGGETDRGQRFARYIGRSDDPGVMAWVVRFQRIKAVRAERTTTVRALIGAGVPQPDRITGRIIEALAKARLFSDGAVLLGTAAYQTYGGVLGVRLSRALSRPAEHDEGRSARIALRAADQIPNLLAALRGIDSSFAPIASAADVVGTTRFRNAGHLQINVHVASELAVLVDESVQSIVLHGPGIPVIVPAPECWVVSTLLEQGWCINSTDDPNQAFARAAEVIEALSMVGREHALARAFDAAWHRALKAKVDLRASVQHLPAPARAILQRHAGIREASSTPASSSALRPIADSA